MPTCLEKRSKTIAIPGTILLLTHAVLHNNINMLNSGAAGRHQHHQLPSSVSFATAKLWQKNNVTFKQSTPPCNDDDGIMTMTSVRAIRSISPIERHINCDYSSSLHKRFKKQLLRLPDKLSQTSSFRSMI